MNKEISMKEKEYINYIDNHKNNVEYVYNKYNERICDELSVNKYDRKLLDNNIKIHDNSKYTKEEFYGYRQYFYPTKNEVKNIKIYNKAWEHHYKNNPHHWDYWLHNDEPTPMPMAYLLELFYDWEAMSLKFGGSSEEYYEAHKNEIKLHKKTIEKLQEIFKIYKKIRF